MMVQPYVRSVEGYGERALVWIDGELTHAVRKSPRYHGQDESVSAAVPLTEDERELATGVVAPWTGELLYARVDVARGEDGKPMLMELELCEPSLFLAQAPRALERFAHSIRERAAGTR